jgi:hypothetical protein
MPYWQPDREGDGLSAERREEARDSGCENRRRAAVPAERETTMTYNALALFVRAAMFGQRGNEQSTHDPQNGTMRAGAGLRHSAPDDLEMAEDDYYRLPHARRD